MQYDKTASHADTIKTESKIFDLVAKITDVSISKIVDKSGIYYTVAEMILVDKNGKVKISVWDTSIVVVTNIPDTHGIILIGVIKTRYSH